MELDLFLQEIIGVIQSVHPEMPGMEANPRRIFTTVQALRQSFVEAMKADKVELPCYAISLGKETEADFGVYGGTYRRPISIWYIEGAGTGSQITVHTRLRALRDEIDLHAVGRETFKAVERGFIDTSESEAVNAALVGDSGVRIVAGRLTYEPGFLVYDGA